MTKNISNRTKYSFAKLIILALLVMGCFSQTVLAQNTDTSRLGVIEKKVAQGSKIVIDSRFGNLNVIGWDRAELQATADEIPLTLREEGNKFIVSAPYAQRHSGFDMSVKVPKGVDIEILDKRSGDLRIENITGTTTLSIISGDVDIINVGALDLNLSSGDVHIEQAGRTSIKTRRGNISLENASGAVSITSFSGDVSVKNVQGELACKSVSGDIDIENITGLVNLSLSSGEAHISNLENDLLISAISGEIKAQCIKGRVDINSASGSIELGDVTDDIQVVTVNGDITVESAIRPKGRYSLKTTSGDISLVMQDNPPGFSADMFCYKGEIETDLELKIEPNSKNVVKHGQESIIGRYGDGQTQIKLSTFTGAVTLLKGYKKSSSECK